MKKQILCIISCLNLIVLTAQIGISSSDEMEVHPFAIVQIDNHYSNENKGVLLPNVTNPEHLPIYSQSLDGSEIDATMKGMVFFDQRRATIYSYDGERWLNEAAKDDFKQNKSRFTASGNNNQEVVCALLICGRHQLLEFSKPINGVETYNNLNISQEDANLKYGAITYTHKHSKFVIQEAGLYNISVSIPSKTGGLVSLTSGPRYQIRAYIKKEDSSFSELKLTDFAPDYYGILGIGGDTNTGAYSSTQIRLKEGDYIISRIDSPGGAVSLVATLTAADNQTIADNYPREIIFTKISD